MPDLKPPVQSEFTNPTGMFLRIFWMFAGNIVLAVSALSILTNRSGLFSKADVFYAAAVPLMIVARYVEITRYNGTTVYGQPATMGHFVKFAASLAAGSVLVWAALHGISYLMTR